MDDQSFRFDVFLKFEFQNQNNGSVNIGVVEAFFHSQDSPITDQFLLLVHAWHSGIHCLETSLYIHRPHT